MIENLKKYSKLVGAVLGVANGIPQGIDLSTFSPTPQYSDETLIFVALFGLIGPPVLAFLGSFIKPNTGLNLMKKVNEFVNIYFLPLLSHRL